MLLSHFCVFGWIRCIQGRIQRFWKGGSLYAGHHGWPTKKSLALRWSKKSKIMFETLRFWWNISISIFKCLHFYTVKVCWWDLANFSKIYWCFDKERKKHSQSKRKTEKNGRCLIIGWFIKPFKIIIIIFFRKLIRSAIFDFCYQDGARNIKMGNWERQIARHCKLQNLFKK